MRKTKLMVAGALLATLSLTACNSAQSGTAAPVGGDQTSAAGGGSGTFDTLKSLTEAVAKKSESAKTGDGWAHRESHYGSFTRAIPLPEAVDPAKVSARYDKGVLTVELTKSPTATSRKVPVQLGA